VIGIEADELRILSNAPSFLICRDLFFLLVPSAHKVGKSESDLDASLSDEILRQGGAVT
jgi:hypothetical protein